MKPVSKQDLKRGLIYSISLSFSVALTSSVRMPGSQAEWRRH